MRRAHRTTAFVLTTTCAVGLLAAAPVAAQLRGEPSPSGTECGGLRPDGRFSDEAVGLGKAHACEHLRARRSTGVSHPSELASRGRLTTAALESRAPAQVGSWSKAVDPGTKTIGISAVLMHTGKVLLFGGRYTQTNRNTAAFLYDPVKKTGHEVPAPAAVYCGGVTILSDGRMFSSGGAFPTVPYGIRDQYLFNPVTENWVEQSFTERARYYPTTTKLGNGSVVVTAGTQADGVTRNPDVELYTPPGPGQQRGATRVVGADHPTAFYPRQWTMPDGNMLQVDNKQVYRLDTHNDSWDWNPLAPLPLSTGPGAAGLMLPAGPKGSSEVMMVGGLKNGQAISATQRYDYNSPGAGWSAGPPMPNPRSHMNVVQVPDGSAFAIGGNSASSYDQGQTQTLHYDPKANRWSRMAVQSVRRAYHSTAVLLPDGRIMSAGDTGPGGGRSAIDFYSPPYLFQGARPTIDSAPKQVGFRSGFTIKTSGPRVGRAVLMAPSATTHANDMHARRVSLAVDRVAGGFRATAPRAAVAPPGYYMLFVLTPDGVPSKAKWVHLGP